MLVTDSATLADLCADFRRRGAFALDTEFLRDSTYTPRLYLVQVAAGDVAAAIDPLAGVDLGPLEELVSDPAVEVIVHAGWQDFEIFLGRTGKVPRHPKGGPAVEAIEADIQQTRGFIRDLEEAEAIYRRLIGLTRNQSKVLQAGVSPELIDLARAKEEEMARLSVLEARMGPARTAWTEMRERISGELRGEVQAIVARVENVLLFLQVR